MSLISLSTWSNFESRGSFWAIFTLSTFLPEHSFMLKSWGWVHAGSHVVMCRLPCGGGPCDYCVSPSPFGLDFGTLDFGTSDLGLTILRLVFFSFQLSSALNLHLLYSDQHSKSMTFSNRMCPNNTWNWPWGPDAVSVFKERYQRGSKGCYEERKERRGLDLSHASPFGIPSKKNVQLYFSTFSDSKVAKNWKIYVRSLGSGGFLRKYPICHILEGKFSHFWWT